MASSSRKVFKVREEPLESCNCLVFRLQCLNGCVSEFKFVVVEGRRLCGLKFYGKPLESGVEHLFRDNVLDATGDDVEQPLADVVLPDDEGDFANGDAGGAVRGAGGAGLSDDRAEVPALLLGEEGGVQFRNDGVASVGIYDAYERVDAAGLVLGVGAPETVAEVEDLAA